MRTRQRFREEYRSIEHQRVIVLDVVCLCVCVCVCVYACVWVRVYVRVCVCVSVCVSQFSFGIVCLQDIFPRSYDFAGKSCKYQTKLRAWLGRNPTREIDPI